jgi:hypothetical protein
VQIDPRAAEASLADIDAIVGRLKQSALYRGSSTITIVWGLLVAFGYVATQLAPSRASIIWIVADGLGFFATIGFGLRLRRAGAEFDWRIVAVILLIFGFGTICAGLGHYGSRELSVFWPILFMLGYAIAGLWLGRVFVLIGIGIPLLALFGYFYIDGWFQAYLAIVNGGGLIFAGWWMRRA